MFEANCLQESPARIANRVLKEREPCLVSARPGEQGVLLPYEERYLPVLESHPRVIDALLADLKKPGTDMAMYCLQVGITQEQDAFRYLDGRDQPVLAMVGVKRFQRWAKKASAPRGAGKRKPVAQRAVATDKAAVKSSPAKKKTAPRARRTTPRR